MGVKKTLLDVIFTEQEVNELHIIKEKAVVRLWADLEINPFTCLDEGELRDFIREVLESKGVEVDSYTVESILRLVRV
jgi:hypothetical protein